MKTAKITNIHSVHENKGFAPLSLRHRPLKTTQMTKPGGCHARKDLTLLAKNPGFAPLTLERCSGSARPLLSTGKEVKFLRQLLLASFLTNLLCREVVDATTWGLCQATLVFHFGFSSKAALTKPSRPSPCKSP